jgi:YggT family protein
MNSVVSVIVWLLNLLSLLIIVRALLSWFYPVGRDPWTRVLLDVTEPILAPIRSALSRLLTIPIDLSPIAALLLISLLENLLRRAL